jgi:adenylate cyclase
LFGTALKLSANSGETHYLLGRACLAELEFELSAIMFERAARLRDDDYHSLLMAGKVRQAVGDEGRARTNYALAYARIQARRIVDGDDFRALCCEARCLWQLGFDGEAHALMDSIVRHPDPMNYHLACTFARSGRNDDALNVLEQVVELGWRHKAWLERDPDIDVLRDHPRFKRIVASLH